MMRRAAIAIAAAAFVLLAPAYASAAVRPAVGSLPFPRTALWWPSQALPSDGLARYDLLILHDFDRARVAEVRRLHPDEVILDSGNACELPYDPYASSTNAALRKVPAQWVLTQVGSTLAAPVSDTTAVFTVAAVISPDGLVLFRAGDAVVVDGEIAFVTAVDATARTLTVKRGAVKAPAAHAAGTRIAAAVSYYGHDLIMDCSTNCPHLVADDAVGAEDWTGYNARTTGALLGTADWNGVMVDRADADGSWVIGYSSARSIDPDRVNLEPSGYDAFDAEWNAGLREFESKLRALAGERLVVGNWAMPNYDLLDGDVFEAFPRTDGTSYNGTWRQTAFGPFRGYGGLLEWAARARQPAVDLVATYDRDDYDDAALFPLAAVRKARFGLGTALLADGFFTYQYNPDGRGSSALSWFDAFDGGGLGRGYLGLPSAAATVAVPPLTTPNLVTAGGFDSATDLAAWSFYATKGYAATASLAQTYSPAGGTCALVDVTQAAGTDWRLSFNRGSVGAVTAGREYTVSFWAKADRERDVSVWLQGDHDDTRHLVEFGGASLDTGWRLVELSAKCVASSGSDGTRLHIGLGSSVGDVLIDGVSVRQGTRAVWRRPFGGGVVVVNASATTLTVDLGERLKAFTGWQDPAVDDGAERTYVTVPPLDARFLVRPAVQALPPLDRAASLWLRAASSAEAARLRSLEPRRTRVRVATTALAWQRARDACYAALAAEQAARSAIAGGDSAATRAAVDRAVQAGRAAVRACSVRDPIRLPEGLAARRAANAALAATLDAHAVLP